MTTVEGALAPPPEAGWTERRIALGLRPHFLAVAGGAVYGFVWFAGALGPLIPLAFLLELLALRSAATGRHAVRLGALAGMARYLVGAHFMLVLVHYSPLGIVYYALCAVYGAVFGFLEFGVPYGLERITGWPRTACFALVYPLAEWLRTASDLSMPADLVAHGLGGNPHWLAPGAWVGPFGVALQFTGVAALLALAIAARARRRRAAALAAAGLALWVVPALVDVFRPAAEHGAVLRVGIVQPSITPEQKLADKTVPSLQEELEALTLEVAPGTDLVLWPESTRPRILMWEEGSPLADPRMERLAHDAGVPILYGAVVARVREGRVTTLYNGAVLVRPDRGPSQWYAKQQLLPFAEGLPLAGLFGFDTARRHHGASHNPLTLLGNFSPGERPTVFEVGPARIGVLICYEGMYPALARRYRALGANALAVLTNDAWWRRSGFAAWHSRLAAARARENGVPVVRAANSGVSTVISGEGRAAPATRLFERCTVQLDVPLGSARPTPYARTGDLVLPGSLLVLAGAAVWRIARRRRGQGISPCEETTVERNAGSRL
ncbi:MAG: apolipoprotein N-acyltransferase [Acidobacteria bacterium]|nr:apolipoprotein N-acyltransferase [Acidobacteriota bacterium]